MNTAILAKDIMTTKLVKLTPDMDVFDAIDRMLKHRISGAPVVDADDKLVGIFSEKDSMRVLVEAATENLPTANLDAFMCKEVKTITEDVDLLAIAQIFKTSSYRRLPVVRDGRLVGQISRSDLLRAAAKQLQRKARKGSSFLFFSSVSNRADAPIS